MEITNLKEKFDLTKQKRSVISSLPMLKKDFKKC